MRLATLAMTCALAGIAGIARAAVVQIDARGVFNADVILNNGTGTLDPTQDPIDLGALGSDNFCFPTQSAAAGLAPITPSGVPDDARFLADAFHPDVALWWDNADDGINARRIAAATDVFSVDVPPAPYESVHVFATSGDGASDITVTLEYTDLTVDSAFFVVPDWFDEVAPTADTYYLIDGRDRVQVGSGPGTPYAYEDRDDAAIFGFRVPVRAGQVVQRVKVERTNTTGVFDFFGAVAVEAPALPSLYESPVARGLLDPANIVATGVTTPFPWSPPSAPLLCYFIDDGAGTPRLIYVAKAGGGLKFTF